MFEWKIEDGLVMFRIPGSGSKHEHWQVLEELAVYTGVMCSPIISFTYDSGEESHMTQEDPEEYSEEGREEMRKLLRHLNYQRKKTWTWTRP